MKAPGDVFLKNAFSVRHDVETSFQEPQVFRSHRFLCAGRADLLLAL